MPSISPHRCSTAMNASARPAGDCTELRHRDPHRDRGGRRFRQHFRQTGQRPGHPGDVLLTLSINGTAENMVAAIDAAADRQMRVIALTGRDGGRGAEIRTNDIERSAHRQSMPRDPRNHRLVIHCLCDLIDLQLMGG